MKTNTFESNLEPTLYDVIEIMNNGFDRLGVRIDGLDGQFEEAKVRFDKVEKRLGAVEMETKELNYNVGSLETKITSLALKVDEIDERLDGFGKAFDVDTKKILNHEKRIKKLERLRFSI